MAADPTSGVLLLAGPAAAELWPGVTLTAPGEPGDHTRVRVPGIEGDVLVRALPPRRTPTSYVIRFTFLAPGFSPCDGELTLAYAPGGDGDTACTHATLVMRAPEQAAGVIERLHADAGRFLERLAEAAEDRAHAV